MLLNPLSRLKAPPKEVELKSKHLHEYMRSSSNKDIYRCVDPDCTHYQQKEFLVGKRARCHKCKNDMILTKDQLMNKIPSCMNCSKSRVAKRVKDVRGFLEEILPKEKLNESI